MRAREHQIGLICPARNGETYKRACTLLKLVDLVCAPGTGYAVPAEGQACIPAICARLASEQLNNNDVKEHAARAAACVSSKIFDDTLNRIRNALDAHYKKRAAEERKHFYSEMMKTFRIAQRGFLGDQMGRAEEELIQSGKLRSGRRKHYDEEDVVIRVAVFYWTCSKCGKALKMKKRNISPKSLAGHYTVETRDIVEIHNVLENVCHKLGEEIGEAVRRLDATKGGDASAPPSPTKAKHAAVQSPATARVPSPIKASSPIKSAMRPNLYAASSEKTRTPTRKRNYPSLDFDADPDETPTKPRKKPRFTDNPQRNDVGYAAFHEAFTTPRARGAPALSQQAAASSSKVALEKAQSDEEDEGVPEPVSSKDADEELGLSDDSGLQSDHQMSEMEVEGYIDTTVPLNDTDNDEPEPEPESELPTVETNTGLVAETPRRSQHAAHFPMTPRSTRRDPDTLPRTPTRKGSAVKSTPTPNRQRKALTMQVPSLDEEAEAEEVAPRRRCRPVLLSHRQWSARDPRVEKQMQLAAAWKTEMVGRYGYPPALEKLRLLVIDSSE